MIRRRLAPFKAMNLFETETFIEGFTHLEGLLPIGEQQMLVAACRRVCLAEPLWTPIFAGKGFKQPFSLQNTNCGVYGWLGDESGFRYSRTSQTGKPWQPIPDEINGIVSFLKSKNFIPKSFVAENCLINYYTGKNHLGLHQDKTERNRTMPIISISLGLSCVFQIGGPDRKDRISEVILKSGDVVIMGGGLRGARNAFHGVKALLPGTCPKGLMKSEARINITLRQVD